MLLVLIEENIDIDKNFISLMNSINKVAQDYNLPIIFSTHPRTFNKIENMSYKFHANVKLINPLGFFDYIFLQKNSLCVLSDSGTISEESAMMNFKAISIRTSTERPEAIDLGSIILGGINERDILNSINTCLKTDFKDSYNNLSEYKIINVSEKVIRIIQSYSSIVDKVIWDKC